MLSDSHSNLADKTEITDKLAAFAGWVAGPAFSCLGARSAVRRGVLSSGEFGALDDRGTTGALHEALEEFVKKRPAEENFSTFVAVFDGPLGVSEDEFEVLLWNRLSWLREYEQDRYAWAPDVDCDPKSERFGFSIAEEALFVVGMHAQAARISRRFPYPAMAFNPHGQFRRLRELDMYAGLQQRIRQRELRLQDSLNPNLADHGEASEARQYSGRRAEADWQCPHGAFGREAKP